MYDSPPLAQGSGLPPARLLTQPPQHLSGNRVPPAPTPPPHSPHFVGLYLPLPVCILVAEYLGKNLVQL